MVELQLFVDIDVLEGDRHKKAAQPLNQEGANDSASKELRLELLTYLRYKWNKEIYMQKFVRCVHEHLNKLL